MAPEEEFQRELKLARGVKRLGHMAAVKSISDSLAWEAAEAKRWADAEFASTFGGDAQETSEGESDVGTTIMVAGDLVMDKARSFTDSMNGTAAVPPSQETPAAPTPTAAPLTAKDVENTVVNVLTKISSKRKAAKSTAAANVQPTTYKSDFARNLLYGAIATAALGLGLGTPMAIYMSGAPDTDTDTSVDVVFPE